MRNLLKPFERYAEWSLTKERYMLWGFWVPLVVMVAVVTGLYVLLYAAIT